MNQSRRSRRDIVSSVTMPRPGRARFVLMRRQIALFFFAISDQSAFMGAERRVHGSCVARGNAAVLIVGPSGAGKSDLALRLLGRGFMLVADDQVDIIDGRACAPKSLAGLLEVRGLGIVRLPYLSDVELKVVITLTGSPERLPLPELHPVLDLPVVRLFDAGASAPDRVALALDCALGLVTQHVGAFAA
jgi:HPr kinase/phosphorylase